MTKIEPRLLKGFRDYPPLEQANRQRLFFVIQQQFEKYGFLPLSTPALEYKEILLGKYGEGEKLVYSFTDNGDREVALRYDLTVPLARYVAQNQGKLVLPFKRYQIAPVWRADKPQKGRFREFYQCDVDVVGSDSLLADAEIIACLASCLQAVGVGDLRVRFNDRRFFSLLTDSLNSQTDTLAVIRAIDKLDKIGIAGVLAELGKLNISIVDQTLIQNFLELGTGQPALTKISQMFSGSTEISDRCLNLIELLKQQGVGEEVVVFDPGIARGLDYYTSTVFEIVLATQPEYGSICAGGRYDGLLDQFSSKSISGVGGSIGIDRLISALQTRENSSSSAPVSVKALILNQSSELTSAYISLAAQLRKAGISVEVYYDNDKLDKQFRYAELKNIPYGIIIGPQELANGTAQLKNLSDRSQRELRIEELPAVLEITAHTQ